MDVDKASLKGLGFFGLFGRGRRKKSKKRPFSESGTESPTPRNTGDEKEVDGGAPSTPSNLILEDALSLKESSEHSFSSSVVDEEVHARRGPTVVARLMGLDSMPLASSSASYSMPLTVQRPLRNNDHDEMIGTSYVGSPSPHKMLVSLIDRFRMEAPPPRFGKRTLPVAQYKLFSPVKNHNHISSRNAADIMEAAFQIIGPGVDNTSSCRGRDVGYTNVVGAFNPTKTVRVQQRSPTLNEATKKRDGSASSRPPSGKPLDGRMKTSERAPPVGQKVMSGSISSPDSRATNAQGSEGKLATRRDPGRNLVERNGQNQQKINNQIGMSSSSSMLMQNSRKQNDMVVKNKVGSKPARLSQQQSNMRSTNGSPRKVAATSTLAENGSGGNRKLELQPINYRNRRLDSIAKIVPKPRRLPHGRMYSNKSQSNDKFDTDRNQRRVWHNIVTDEQSSFSTDKKKMCTEIVSFTFTLPVDKSSPGSQFPNHLVEKGFAQNVNSVSASSNTSSTKPDANTSSTKPDAIDGDFLGLLLEQKLREYTSGVRSPYCKQAKGVRIYAPSPVLEDTTSACESSSIASTGYDRESLQSFRDGKAKFLWTDLASKSGQSYQYLKYDNDAIDQAELDILHLSPQSTWEASLSTETCSSVESWKSAKETRLSSSTEGAATSASGHYSRSSDTASSIAVTAAEIPPSESSNSCHMDYRQEIYFVREILDACSLSDRVCSLELFASSDILDPNLLEVLNGNFSLAVGQEDGKSSRMIRRLLFDCMNEILSVKCEHYFSAGYGSWFMGMAVLQKLSPEEIYQEMNSLKVADEWMVDELVYREMGVPRGSWVDFKTESYEAGKDITTELLGSLLDEIVADLLTDALSCRVWFPSNDTS